MRTSRIIGFALLCLSLAAQNKVTFPKTLEGSGRVCWGHLWRTDKTLYWKSVFASCKSPYTVISQEGLHWVLKVNRSKMCAYEKIEVESQAPDNPSVGFWSVSGYTHALTDNDSASCTMYDVTPSALRRARKELADSKGKNL